MKNVSASPREMAASLVRNKGLTRKLVHRDVVGRYMASMLGIFWSLATPIFMLAVNTFVFSVVYKVRWEAGGSDSETENALVLFAGLMIFTLFSECIGRAPGLILSNVNYAKKMVFPFEVPPRGQHGQRLVPLRRQLGRLAGSASVLFDVPHGHVLLLPLVLGPLVLFAMGLSLALASLGEHLRDVGQTIGLVTTTLTNTPLKSIA